jgi:hypothetical protein
MNPNLQDLARETKNPDVKAESNRLFGDDVIVFSTIEAIVALIDGRQQTLKYNDDSITDMCFSGKLYDAGMHGMKETFSHKKIIDEPVTSICVCADKLCAARYKSSEIILPRRDDVPVVIVCIRR